MNILIINGPNLNMLGTREPDIYGTMSYSELVENLETYAEDRNIKIDIKQSNLEGIIIDMLQYASHMGFDAVILNAAAFTHYSYALYDAIKAIDVPVYEVHLSDPDTREETFRHTSVIRSACVATFKGEGVMSYKKAIDTILDENDR